MPRIPKRLLALGGIAAGAAAVLRSRRARPAAPAPTPAPTPNPAPPVASAGATASASAPGTTPDFEDLSGRPVGGAVDDLVEEETAAAAREAAGIGGPRLDDAHGDPAFEPVYEAGGGEAEGFELAEEELIENATHGDGRADPEGDAFTAEAESDEATGVDGEPDEEQVSEVVADPSEEREDDPGAGPGITHDR